MNWIKVPNSQFIRILEKCPDRDSNQGSIGYTSNPVSRPALRPNQPPFQWVQIIISPEAKRGRSVMLIIHSI
jgi:hypothetical protein